MKRFEKAGGGDWERGISVGSSSVLSAVPSASRYIYLVA